MDSENTNIQASQVPKTSLEPVPFRVKRKFSESSSALKPTPFQNVKLTDHFWKNRITTNRKITIPLVINKCQDGRIYNFFAAGSKLNVPHEGIYFDDSDVYKLLEGITYCLQDEPDEELENIADDIIDKITLAQWEDGYLNTYYSIPQKRREKRWQNLKDRHELYCAGHLIEAAIAYFEVTRDPKLLNVAIKFVDHINTRFGPHGKKDVDGHPEIELSLMKLFRLTGKEEYLKLAKFFLDERGNNNNRKTYGTYSQDHKLVAEQDEAVGHAVRAGYLYCAMADIVAQTGNPEYHRTLDRIWDNVVSKKIYITGGVGSKHEIEGYGQEYELPNKTAYCETCASIANIFWNHRMFLLHPHAKYIDVLERILYNSLLAGISLEGDAFFYVNPLEHDGEFLFNINTAGRQPWYSCACCPTNLVRFIPTVPGYIFTQYNDDLFVNLFIACHTTLFIKNQKVQFRIVTEYPWDGKIQLIIKPERNVRFQVRLRIPGWSQGKPLPSDLYRYLDHLKEEIVLKINGHKIEYNEENGYALIDRLWTHEDCIEMNLPMPVNRVICHEKVAENRGKIALERGPLVYCAEWPDNKTDIDQIHLNRDMTLHAEFHPDLLNGIVLISDTKPNEQKNSKITAIPYFAWSHRGMGKMAVWLPCSGA